MKEYRVDITTTTYVVAESEGMAGRMAMDSLIAISSTDNKQEALAAYQDNHPDQTSLPGFFTRDTTVIDLEKQESETLDSEPIPEQ